MAPELAVGRGITLYLPFEGSAEPQYTRTGAPPTYNDSVHFVEGRAGQAALFRRSREVEEGKARGRATGLNYDALGLLYGERGAMAFWVQPQWDGDDPTIRNGPNGTGPSLMSVSSVEPTYYQQFIRWQIKGDAFYIWVVDRDGKPHGTASSSRLQLWRRGEWHHFALSWDCGQGVRLYEDGELVHDTCGKESWTPATPSTIGVACPPPYGRPTTTVSADTVIDELLLFDRPLGPADVQAIMAADYAAISVTPPAVTSGSRRQARVLEYGLAPSTTRLAVPATASGWSATVRLCDPLSIDTHFINGRFLADGLKTRLFRLAQGGLSFDRDVRLAFRADYQPSHIVLSGLASEGSELLADGQHVPLQAEADEIQRIRLPQPASNITLKLVGESVLGECQAFRVADGQPATVPEVQPLHLAIEPAALGESGSQLWCEFSPTDRRALLPGAGAAEVPSVRVPALGKLHLFSAPAARDSGIEAIHLGLTFSAVQPETSLAIKVHDPFERNRFRLLFSFMLPAAAAHGPQLDLALLIPGLILPEGGRLWLEIVPDREAELRLAGGGCGIGLATCPAASVSDEFSRSYLRFLNEEFRTRMSHNFRYYSRGVQTDNALTRGLDSILSFDPDNDMALSMHHWARLSPWPAWGQEPPGPQSAPRWARLQRAAVSEALATIHWWIDNRQDQTGYMVGNANEWNDDTKLFNEYAVFALMTGDEKLISAMERYLDAHYASGRMEKGYSRPLTDVVHSQEEASYLAPTLALLRYGDPVHIERLMETAANVPYWTTETAPGQRHFKSNFYTATQMKTDGHFGHDVPLNASTLVPAMMLAWYNGHPTVRQWLLEYADGWRTAAERDAEGKPAGLLPAFVDAQTGALGSAKAVYQRELAYQLFAATCLSGDARYLGPIEQLIRQQGADGVRTLGLVAPEWRRLTGRDELDEHLLAYANALREEMESDSFFQRGVERYDVGAVLGYTLTDDARFLELALLNAWRNNARARPIYTLTDPDKDRVYPWGRVVLPWMMCGGNALNARASAPFPTIAVSWEQTGTDFAAWVRDNSPTSLTVQLYNFGPEREVIMRPWGLAPGGYELRLVGPDGSAILGPESIEVRRGRPIPLRLPTGEPVSLSLRQVEPVQLPKLLPDAAVSASEIAGEIRLHANGSVRLSVPVHNLGTTDLPGGRLQINDATGQTMTEAAVPGIAAPHGLQPHVATVAVRVPEDVAFPLAVAVTVPTEEVTRLNNTCSVHRSPRGSQGDRQ